MSENVTPHDLSCYIGLATIIDERNGWFRFTTGNTSIGSNVVELILLGCLAQAGVLGVISAREIQTSDRECVFHYQVSVQ